MYLITERETLKERDNRYGQKKKDQGRIEDKAFFLVCPSDKLCSIETVRSAFPMNEALK